MERKSKFSPEVRGRGVRLVTETRGSHDSEWAAITSVAEKIGCTPETLRKWLRQSQRDAGKRPGRTTEDRARIKEPEREVHEYGAPMRFSGRRPRISLWRSSTADHVGGSPDLREAGAKRG